MRTHLRPASQQITSGLTPRQYEFLQLHLDGPQPINFMTRQQMKALLRHGLVNLSPQYGPPKFSAISAKGSKLLRRALEREADRLTAEARG